LSNSDWYAKKLGNQVPQQSSQQLPSLIPPSQKPMAPMPSFQPQAQRGLPSSSQTATCPDCGSSNYMAVQNTKARCLDCGYPIEQSGSRYGSLAGSSVQGSAKQAIGNNLQSNYNPQEIIGRING